MSWLNNPKFVRVRESVISRLSAQDVHFRKVLPVVFLCGGFESARRERVAQYLRKKHAGELLLFYADDVWQMVSRRADLNALGMEEQLAVLSDLVIVIVESPGTFAELGAFALAEKLRNKLLPLLDEKHRRAESFVRTGPVAWVDEESRYGPSIWADHDTILDVVDELDQRLERLPKLRGHRVPDLAQSPKHLLFFLADLAAVFGPCPSEHLEEYAQRLIPGKPTVPIEVLLGLSTAMGVVRRAHLPDGQAVFYRPLDLGRLRPFQENQYLRIPRLRAQVLGAMMRIPDGRVALDAMKP